MKGCDGISMEPVQTSGQDLEKASIGDIPRESPIDDDMLAYRFVTDKRLLDFELELFATKWFDYRELTPLQATRLYIEAFVQKYREHYRVNFDAIAGKYVTPISIEKIWKGMREQNLSRRDKANFVGCWRGRQCADALGMPYDVYVDLALTARLNYWNRRNMPQPTHLYSEMVVEKVQERWEELQARKLYLSDRPAYLVQNYAGIAHQDDYHEWLMKQAGLRSNPAEFLACFVNEDVLPLEKVESRYDEHMLERIRRYVLH